MIIAIASLSLSKLILSPLRPVWESTWGTLPWRLIFSNSLCSRATIRLMVSSITSWFFSFSPLGSSFRNFLISLRSSLFLYFLTIFLAALTFSTLVILSTSGHSRGAHIFMRRDVMDNWTKPKPIWSSLRLGAVWTRRYGTVRDGVSGIRRRRGGGGGAQWVQGTWIQVSRTNQQNSGIFRLNEWETWICF